MGLKVNIEDLKTKILELNSQREYVRVKFNYKSLAGFGIYCDTLESFAGVASIYEDRLIFKKTWSGTKYIGLHQIEVHDLEIIKFNTTDLKRCWGSNNDFLKGA